MEAKKLQCAAKFRPNPKSPKSMDTAGALPAAIGDQR